MTRIHAKIAFCQNGVSKIFSRKIKPLPYTILAKQQHS